MVEEGEEAGNALIAISNASSPCWLTVSRRGVGVALGIYVSPALSTCKVTEVIELTHDRG